MFFGIVGGGGATTHGRFPLLPKAARLVVKYGKGVRPGVRADGGASDGLHMTTSRVELLHEDRSPISGWGRAISADGMNPVDENVTVKSVVRPCFRCTYHTAVHAQRDCLLQNLEGSLHVSRNGSNYGHSFAATPLRRTEIGPANRTATVTIRDVHIIRHTADHAT